MKRDATESSVQLNFNSKKNQVRKRESTAEMKEAVRHFPVKMDAVKLRRLV